MNVLDAPSTPMYRDALQSRYTLFVIPDPNTPT